MENAWERGPLRTGGEGAEEPAALRELARRALGFQRFLLRRAWAIYYAVWATAIATYLAAPALADVVPPLTGAAGNAFVVAVDLVVSLLATGVTLQVFRSSHRAGALADAVDQRRPSAMRYVWIAILFFLGFAALLALFALSSSQAPYFLLDAYLAVVLLFLTRQLRRSFRRWPLESRVAVGSFTGGIAVSLGLWFAVPNPLVFALCWVPVVGTWFGCALFGLFYAVEELGQEAPDV